MKSDYAICRQVKVNGTRCQAPALTGRALCFFHRNLHRKHKAAEPSQAALDSLGYIQPPVDLPFPPLEDAESIQLSISLLFRSLAGGDVSTTLARTLLSALRIAAFNVRAIRSVPPSETVVRSVVRTRSGRSFAAPGPANGLPPGPRPNPETGQPFAQTLPDPDPTIDSELASYPASSPRATHRSRGLAENDLTEYQP